MRKTGVALLVCLGLTGGLTAQQTFSGVISDSMCGASHEATAKGANMTERECAFHCLSRLATYVLVTDQKQVIPIVNQDFAGLPLRLARPVRITGAMTEQGLVISRIELPLVHAHIGHVMTAWRDTPGTVGLLTVALSDTRVAAAHALLTSKSTSLDDLKLHAGHVLHALDPTLMPKGPASGYGVKKAAAGALQHVGFAAAADGASAVVKAQAEAASRAMTDALASVDRAIAVAQKIQSAASPDDARAAAADLASSVGQIDAALQQAQQDMRVMMKAEGL